MALELKAAKRDLAGKKLSTLRNEGLVPAELYGRGVENIHLAIKKEEFLPLFRKAGENSMINLQVGSDVHPVLVKNAQWHPISDEIVSIDFYQPRLDEKMEIDVPLSFEGESSAVNDLDGILLKNASELSISTLPTNIPSEIVVDLTKITEIGGSIHVKDLNIPEGVEVLDDAEMTVATVTEKMSVEEDEAMGQEVDLENIEKEGGDAEPKEGEEKSEEGKGEPAEASAE